MTTQSPTSSLSITRFGAVADGATNCTGAIQKALDAAGKAGGGVVSIPPGLYMTGTIFLRSGVTLDIQPGATLLASPDIADYPEMSWGHNKDRQPHHFIVASELHDVTIRGGGTIDGSGPAFWHPQEAPHRWIRSRDRRPSPMLEISGCRDVRISDITLTNSPGWTCHLHDCDRVFIRGVKIDNHLYGPNTDGFDITGSHDVVISDCHVSTGDDAIVLKTTPDSRDLKRVTVTNCILRTQCAALKLGASESFKDMRQVTFSNCVVYESTRAVALYTLEGATLEDIAVSNIVCDTRLPVILNRPIHLDARKKSDNSAAGIIRNVLISNFICRTDGRLLMTAADGTRIEQVTLRDVQLEYPRLDDPAPTGPTAGGSQFSNHSVEARGARAAVVADGLENLVIDNLQIRWPTAGEPAPEQWQFTSRTANGEFGFYDGTTDTAQAPPFNVVWGRRLRGGRIFAPLAAPYAGAEPFDLEGCDIRVVE